LFLSLLTRIIVRKKGSDKGNLLVHNEAKLLHFYSRRLAGRGTNLSKVAFNFWLSFDADLILPLPEIEREVMTILVNTSLFY